MDTQNTHKNQETHDSQETQDIQGTQGDYSNRSYCKYCQYKIHPIRNTIGICQNCKKRKYDTVTEFSFAEGSKRALSESNFNKQQLIQYAQLSNCQPMRLEFFKQNTNDTISAHCLLSNENALYLSKNIPFDNDIQSEVFSGRISFSRDGNGTVINSQMMESTSNFSDNNNDDSILQMTIRASSTPNIINKLGPYSKLNDKTKKNLNFDFRSNPQLLALIPPLFTGAIIQDNGFTLVILSCEVYSRSNNVDIHSEPTEHSIPEDSNGITCSVYLKSDGGREISKLIIGTSFLNLLVVSSIEVSNDPKVHVGPGVDFGHSRISTNTCNLFFREASQQQLIAQFNSNDMMPITLNNMRQLTTQFGKVSTYRPWRSGLSNFNTTLTMPATTVTLCSLPSSGYGFGPNSLSFISSQLLQLFSIAVIYNKCILKNDQLEDFLMDYNPVFKKKTTVKEWDSLIKVVEKLKECQENENINVIEFCQENSLSTIAKGLSSAISTANIYIAKNIKNKFLSIYK